MKQEWDRIGPDTGSAPSRPQSIIWAKDIIFQLFIQASFSFDDLIY